MNGIVGLLEDLLGGSIREYEVRRIESRWDQDELADRVRMNYWFLREYVGAKKETLRRHAGLLVKEPERLEDVYCALRNGLVLSDEDNALDENARNGLSRKDIARYVFLLNRYREAIEKNLQGLLELTGDVSIASCGYLIGRKPEVVRENYRNAIRFFEKDVLASYPQLLGVAQETVTDNVAFLGRLDITYQQWPILCATRVELKKAKLKVFFGDVLGERVLLDAIEMRAKLFFGEVRERAPGKTMYRKAINVALFRSSTYVRENRETLALAFRQYAPQKPF